jgi:hypothetical protein
MLTEAVSRTTSKSYKTERSGPEPRLVGRTVTGPIYLAHGVLMSAPPRVAFENLSELGIRAVRPDAKVLGTIAGRHAGEDAFFANMAFTGLAAGSLFAATPPQVAASGVRRTLNLSARKGRRYGA